MGVTKQKWEDQSMEGEILHGALERGDKAILDLIDDVWGDSFYDMLYEAIEEQSEVDKKQLHEKYAGDEEEEGIVITFPTNEEED